MKKQKNGNKRLGKNVVIIGDCGLQGDVRKGIRESQRTAFAAASKL